MEVGKLRCRGEVADLNLRTIEPYGANLKRLCLMLHAQGQVTMARLTTLLNDIGLDISKRQVVRLLTKDLDGFVAEDVAVLHAGLVSSSYVTVDDTGSRHSHNPHYHASSHKSVHSISNRRRQLWLSVLHE